MISQFLEKQVGLKWRLGSAACRVQLNTPSRQIAQALAPGPQTLTLSPHPVTCSLNRKGKTYPVKFTLAPTLALKDGISTTVDLGLDNIAAPLAIKAILWSASKLESRFKPFEPGIVQFINAFLASGCPHSR